MNVVYTRDVIALHSSYDCDRYGVGVCVVTHLLVREKIPFRRASNSPRPCCCGTLLTFPGFRLTEWTAGLTGFHTRIYTWPGMIRSILYVSSHTFYMYPYLRHPMFWTLSIQVVLFIYIYMCIIIIIRRNIITLYYLNGGSTQQARRWYV